MDSPDAWQCCSLLAGGTMLFEPVIRKLSAFERLSDGEVHAVQKLGHDVRVFHKYRDIITEGENPDFVHVVLAGWAARYTILPDGSRMITAFLIPGDFCDMHVTTLSAMDHSILAVTDCKVAFARKGAIDDITRSTPALTRAFWRSTLVDEAVLRQWLVSVGRRDAKATLAHLLCELHVRLQLVGLAEDGDLQLPLTQTELADATGLTAVHVNRTLRALRQDGLIAEGPSIRLRDIAGLREAGDFNPQYLHLRTPNVMA